MEVKILIVGAGPTGLMLANQLARRGVQTMIIDRHSGPAQQVAQSEDHARNACGYHRAKNCLTTSSPASASTESNHPRWAWGIAPSCR